MKRKLAALLCSVMCISAFTGCSTTELAYLNMSREMIDSMSACAVDGTMQADIDFDGLNDFSKDMTETLYGEGYGTETGLTGKKTLKVDYDINLSPEKIEELCAELKDYGLDGIECQYSTYSSQETRMITAIAEKYGLLPSGGSDFHGKNKPNIHLGSGKSNLAIPYAFWEELKKRTK